jgi:hypothetical protein
MKKSTPPALLYKDMNSTSSTIRDLFSEDVRRVAWIRDRCTVISALTSIWSRAQGGCARVPQ